MSNKHSTEWRRFQIIDKSRENALVKLLDEKGITRNDLILILRTIKFDPNFDPKTEDQQAARKNKKHCGAMSFEQLLEDNNVDMQSFFGNASCESEGG